jgi:NRAMP (natural resistance-associated macrophage protein)-like metal ion transporter
MSKAGANFGLELLWAVLLSCLMTWYLMRLASRFTMVTGMTLLEGFRRHINHYYALLVLVSLSVIIIGALMGVLGIVADVLHVWSRSLVESGVPLIGCAVVTSAIVYGLLYIGDTGLFEKILALLVAVMALAFIATTVMEFPGFGPLLSGLVPSMPEEAAGSDNSSLVIVAGMVGTTVSVFVLVIRTGLVRERGWTMKDAAIERRDATVSATLMFIVSAAVMITAAATLHPRGLHLNQVSEMIPMLEPVFGQFALSVFVAGIVAAGVSSHLPNLLVIPWIVDDYQGVPRNVQTARNRLVLLVLSLVSLFGVVLGFKPVFLMLLSQACIAVVLPLVLGGLAWLTSRESIMGEHGNGVKDCLALIFILGFALYMSTQAVRGLLIDLASVG